MYTIVNNLCDVGNTLTTYKGYEELKPDKVKNKLLNEEFQRMYYARAKSH